MRHFRVAAVQMKFAPTIGGNLGKIRAAVTEAAHRRADAVLFPECAVTGYSCEFRSLRPGELRDARAAVSEIARYWKINILFGTPLFAERRLYNVLLVVGRDGKPVHAYAKCQLTDVDRKFFHPGDAVALFEVDGVPATAIICHERRYPELVRLGVMAGARVLFHPNAGLDTLAVSKTKRNGCDGIDARAFENAIYYVFANSVGPQGGGKWSAGDSKIVAPDRSRLALAGNADEAVIVADLDLSKATGRYAAEGLEHPLFLAGHWKRMISEVRRRASQSLRRFGL